MTTVSRFYQAIKMKIEKLTITDFRNIESLEFEPHESVNIIFGQNAQGKTNLVEAIWLLTGAKSFRRVKSDSEYIRFSAKKSHIEADFFDGARIQNIELNIEDRRKALLNGIKVDSASELAQQFPAVVFSPSHLSLVHAGPSERRKFIDSCLCRISPKFIRTLNDYMRAVTQRNALLKDVRKSSYLLDTLDVWDQSIARTASLIIKMRTKLIDRLNDKAKRIYSGISMGNEEMSLSYINSLDVNYDASQPLSDICADFYNKLKYHLSDDIKYGVTTLGAHRDDVSITLDGKNARNFASQGQSRSIVLALKLAESEILEEAFSTKPVILLDDVMSELDSARREYLLNHIGENQVFVTCCEKAYFEGLKNGVIKEMKSGVII